MGNIIESEFNRRILLRNSCFFTIRLSGYQLNASRWSSNAKHLASNLDIQRYRSYFRYYFLSIKIVYLDHIVYLCYSLYQSLFKQVESTTGGSEVGASTLQP